MCYLVYIVLTNTLYIVSTITISFAVRESKARTSGEAPIQVLLTQNGVRASFSTGKAVHPSEWIVIDNELGVKSQKQ